MEFSTQFQIDFEIKNGFFPKEPPLEILPPKYEALENLLQAMPIVLTNGESGLLGKRELGTTVQESFPLLDISEETDSRLLTALFRDYSFVASAYIFENCYGESQGPPRANLPQNLAIPLVKLGEKLGVRPYLDYAHSYILSNWKKKDETKGLEVENLEVIRSFVGTPSESGFILVTAALNRFSGSLLENAVRFIKSVENRDKKSCVDAMTGLLETMTSVYSEMGKMWHLSKTEDFNTIRNFIAGCKDPTLFPNGLCYEGVENFGEMFLRHGGVSAAADSMIPLLDNILELEEQTSDPELAVSLREFRDYRPKLHQEYLDWTKERSKAVSTKAFAIQANPLIFLQILDQVRQFRARHWRFIKMYILKHSKSSQGTGGGKLNLLPNLLAVLQEMQRVIGAIQTKSFELSDGEQIYLLMLRPAAG